MKLRLWPGISLAIVMLLLRVVAPRVMTEGALVGTLGFTAGGVIIFVWWLFFSRAPWLERLGVLALVAALVISRHSNEAIRRVAIVAAIVIASGLFTLIRTDGLMNGGPQIAW